MDNPFDEALVIFKRNTDMKRLNERRQNILQFVQGFYPEAKMEQVITCPLTSWEEAMQYGTNKAIPTDENGLLVRYWVSQEKRKDSTVYYKLNEYWGYRGEK